MDYGLIGKIEKAKRYADSETGLASSFKATFNGTNNPTRWSSPGGVDLRL
jgi:hypothetical protein